MPGLFGPTSAEQSLARVERQRVNALTSDNTQALADFLSDDLTYTHSSGETQSKSEFMAAIRTGQLRYRSMQHRDVRVRMYGSVGVLTGISDVNVEVQKAARTLHVRFLAVYNKSGNRWRMVAWQSTKAS